MRAPLFAGCVAEAEPQGMGHKKGRGNSERKVREGEAQSTQKGMVAAGVLGVRMAKAQIGGGEKRI
jgi:hypothetical protein